MDPSPLARRLWGCFISRRILSVPASIFQRALLILFCLLSGLRAPLLVSSMEDRWPAEETARGRAENGNAANGHLWRNLLPARGVLFIRAAGKEWSLASSTLILEEKIHNTYYHRPRTFEAAFVIGSAALTAQITTVDDARHCKSTLFKARFAISLARRTCTLITLLSMIHKFNSYYDNSYIFQTHA